MTFPSNYILPSSGFSSGAMIDMGGTDPSIAAAGAAAADAPVDDR